MNHPLYKEALALMEEEAAKPAVAWQTSQITPADLQIIRRESKGGPFDRLNLRAAMNTAVAEGEAHIFANECDYGRIITLTDMKRDPTPLEAWGRILRLFDPTRSGSGSGPKKAKIIWYAHPQPRLWPSRGTPIGPEHINGGYCMPCDPSTVVIYRYEDATRVLMHELLHGFCTDAALTADYGIEQLEAGTEAWAEVLLAAARAAGIGTEGGAKMPGALNAQLEWVALQNRRLRDDHAVSSPADYAWRYTIGKEAALRDLGFFPFIRKERVVPSLRLTPPIGAAAAL